MTAKQELRAQTLAKRDALPSEFRIEAALEVAARFADLAIEPGQIVSAYWPIRSELDVRPLVFALMQQGATIALPAVVDRETIIFRRYQRAETLVKAGFGTMAPPHDAPTVDPAVMLVPMAAFDGQGNRIGYGAGHYDRAIAKLIAKGQRPRLIGVAFDCQRVEAVPAEAHDIALDAVITESGLLTCHSAA